MGPADPGAEVDGLESMRVSVVMPVYNEAATIREIVRRVLDQLCTPGNGAGGWEKELIIVGDGIFQETWRYLFPVIRNRLDRFEPDVRKFGPTVLLTVRDGT